VDHLSSLKRGLIRRRMEKLKAERATDTADRIRRAPEHESAL
jgi:peptide deformylase